MNYKTILLKVKCNSCKAVVNFTAQEHAKDDCTNIVNHVNYCTCGIKFIETKNGGGGNFEYMGRVEGEKQKAKRYNKKLALAPLFDVKDESLYTIRKNT